MIDVNELRRGISFTFDGNLYRVQEYHHHKPGRGKATIKVEVRDLRSGTIKEMTFNSGDRVENIRLSTRAVEYLYDDGGLLYFMDIETYDQPAANKSMFGDDFLYLTPNTQIKLTYYDEEIIEYELPVTIEHEVESSEMAVAGDTATGATKQVITQTGLTVTVPLFVEVGDVIRVDSRTGDYITRV